MVVGAVEGGSDVSLVGECFEGDGAGVVGGADGGPGAAAVDVDVGSGVGLSG